jgi:hypothetical protein
MKPVQKSQTHHKQIIAHLPMLVFEWAQHVGLAPPADQPAFLLAMWWKVFENHDPRAPFRAQERLVLARLGVLRHLFASANERAAALKLQQKGSPPIISGSWGFSFWHFRFSLGYSGCSYEQDLGIQISSFKASRRLNLHCYRKEATDYEQHGGFAEKHK